MISFVNNQERLLLFPNLELILKDKEIFSLKYKINCLNKFIKHTYAQNELHTLNFPTRINYMHTNKYLKLIAINK